MSRVCFPSNLFSLEAINFYFLHHLLTGGDLHLEDRDINLLCRSVLL